MACLVAEELVGGARGGVEARMNKSLKSARKMRKLFWTF